MTSTRLPLLAPRAMSGRSLGSFVTFRASSVAGGGPHSLGVCCKDGHYVRQRSTPQVPPARTCCETRAVCAHPPHAPGHTAPARAPQGMHALNALAAQCGTLGKSPAGAVRHARCSAARAVQCGTRGAVRHARCSAARGEHLGGAGYAGAVAHAPRVRVMPVHTPCTGVCIAVRRFCSRFAACAKTGLRAPVSGPRPVAIVAAPVAPGRPPPESSAGRYPPRSRSPLS
jgi:hypothetical protein